MLHMTCSLLDMMGAPELLEYLHAALDALRAHVGDELQRAAQLLPGAAQRDHGGVAIGVAQPRQLVVLRQPPHPVEQLPRPDNNKGKDVKIASM